MYSEDARNLSLLGIWLGEEACGQPHPLVLVDDSVAILVEAVLEHPDGLGSRCRSADCLVQITHHPLELVRTHKSLLLHVVSVENSLCEDRQCQHVRTCRTLAHLRVWLRAVVAGVGLRSHRRLWLILRVRLVLWLLIVSKRCCWRRLRLSELSGIVVCWSRRHLSPRLLVTVEHRRSETVEDIHFWGLQCVWAWGRSRRGPVDRERDLGRHQAVLAHLDAWLRRIVVGLGWLAGLVYCVHRCEKLLHSWAVLTSKLLWCHRLLSLITQI